MTPNHSIDRTSQGLRPCAASHAKQLEISMSRAYQSFEYGIKDAEELLAHFDVSENSRPLRMLFQRCCRQQRAACP